MKLNLQTIQNKEAWRGYHLPDFNIKAMAKATQQEPIWFHFGSGNIFRAFICKVAQRMLEQGEISQGIICAAGHGTETVTKCLQPHDNLSIAVEVHSEGRMKKEIIGSIGESLTTQYDWKRIQEIFCAPSLQLVSFTITEKGYAIRDTQGKLIPKIEEDMKAGPDQSKHLMSLLAALCIKRSQTCKRPLALVSMDNCSHNSEKIQNAVLEIAGAWRSSGKITQAEYAYLQNKVSYPWSMIDKITPRPDARVEAQLKADGLEGIEPFVTKSGTYIAPFVNAERSEYLVIEDTFPNGRPALEKAGVRFTDRDTVNMVERMKVCTCLNPVHTALAIYGCLLGFTSIAEEMKDPELSQLVKKMSEKEGMPVVTDPKIINPRQFLNEVLNERLPNPFMPDTPQRIAADTSQKLAIRFGEAIKSHVGQGDARSLKLIPLVLAGWLRYLLAVDDNGAPFEPSPDPLLMESQAQLKDIMVGGAKVNLEQLKPLLTNKVIFGVDLCEIGMAELIIKYFNELIAGKGAVRKTLRKYVN